MTSPIQSKGVPLSSIFDLYQAGTTKARASGIDEAGNDTSNIYANIIYGSAAAATGIDSEGVDLNTLYAKIGTATYSLPFNGHDFQATSDKAVNPDTNTSVTISINSDGTYTNTIVQGDSPGGSVGTGTWLPSGDAASNYQVEFVWNQTSVYGTTPATITNGASTYQACTTTRAFASTQNVPTGGDAGSVGTLTINLKKISTGVVTTTTCTIDVHCFNSA